MYPDYDNDYENDGDVCCDCKHLSTKKWSIRCHYTCCKLSHTIHPNHMGLEGSEIHLN